MTAAIQADARSLDGTAVQDPIGVCDYIGEHNSSATARRVALLIHEGIGSLAKFPYRGRPGRKADTRELIVTNLPYVVIYRIRHQVIEANRILHGAQNWPE